ncbi:IclR family transcriptional regulator [Bradyrhizobium sp. GCM10027634]|uniref:IclR family transcriptional regulator n=1 Tax=unclassified Bradyrhizobium TaxID=2631580 RepID=UPI00188BC0AD|nr:MULTISPECIES: IclR family transcriptional regulator [unclassified Bradyrhizobium]MDN5001811.1 IclR family transcriptional regulator [Bradyrhizobium sp. WYCCWR 12677]QOZ45879.1 IclR family transcriptional regulator [Bradyrhizobium sp. CCBAU 53340]
MAKTGVDAVARALAILKTFRPERSALTLTEIADATDLYKSTVLRLAATLEADGFLVRGPDRLFRPGPELWRLGALYQRGLDLGDLIRPTLHRLVEATGETASFYIADGDERICLYRVNSPRSVRHHLDEGQRLPIDRGAAGRVLTAYRNPASAESKKIREHGFYVSLGERDPEVAAAAVPVIDVQGKLRGALSVSAIRTRFDANARKAAIDVLKSEAKALTGLLPAGES